MPLAPISSLPSLPTLPICPISPKRQAMDLVSGSAPQRLMQQAAAHGVVPRVKSLPDLSHMTNLTALNLADNNLHEVGQGGRHQRECVCGKGGSL